MRTNSKKVWVLALLSIFTMTASAQSIGDLLKKAASSVTSNSSTVETVTGYVTSLLGTDKVTAKDIVGTWTYSEPALVFESDNVLNKLGGVALAETAENKLASTLNKVGVKSGSITLTFKSDNTYTCKMGGRSITGTYEVSNATLTLKKLNYTTLQTNIKKTGSTLQLAVEADKLLTLISSVSSVVPQQGVLSTVTSLVNSYDGLQVGLKFKK